VNNLIFKPETEWVKPTEFPDLTDRPEIAIDLETQDPDLKSKGSGSVIKNGKVVGISDLCRNRRLCRILSFRP